MGAMEIIAKMEERERIINSQTSENKIKMMMVDLDVDHYLNVDNEIYEFDVYETKKSDSWNPTNHNIIGMDYEILFQTKTSYQQLNELCRHINRLPFANAHYDEDQIECAFACEEEYVQVTLYTDINADYKLTEDDIKFFDIEKKGAIYNVKICKRL